MKHTCHLLVVFTLAAGAGTVLGADEYRKSIGLWSTAEWSYTSQSVESNPFDVVGRAVFTHEETGEVRKTEMFVQGDHTWQTRFVGTRPGKWTFVTECDGREGVSDVADLHGHSGAVTVADQPRGHGNGFMTHFGNKWGWQGAQQAFVPQYVMAKELDAYYDFTKNQVDEAAVDRDVQEFIAEHGFTGFHLQGQGRWFGLKGKPNPDLNPDPRAYDVVETIIRKVHEAGGACHIWMWGSDSKKGGDGPRGVVGGPMNEADRRNIRYFAARLGPLPGWSLGYGFDTENLWASPDELTAWKEFLESHLGWDHFIGSRVGFDEKGTWGQYGKDIPKAPLNEKFNAPIGDEYTSWLGGDYMGYTSYRPLYDRYVVALQHRPDQPSFEEDRFRLREAKQWTHKDYSAELTCKGLWHSTMAGGVANIWGNLLPTPDKGGSRPYDHGIVQVKERIKTYATFFQEKRRFRRDFVRANDLAGSYEGTTESPDAVPVSVCLRSPEDRHFLFYKEDCTSLGMELSAMKGRQTAVAVDARRRYKEINLGKLAPGEHEWQAPYKSDWAVAVGQFE